MAGDKSSAELGKLMKPYVVIIQARMSSQRFPGKMLAPLLGQPVIAHVLDRIAEVTPREMIMVATSEEPSDDPLSDYVANRLGYTVVRGSLDNVVLRFQTALRQHPAKWFVRICGESPAIDSGLLTWMLACAGEGIDIVSNIFRRTFPYGQSIEIIRSATFLAIDSTTLSPVEQEHVTLGMYRRASDFRIVSVEAAVSALSQRRYVVDTLEDMEEIEKILKNSPQLTRGFDVTARLTGGKA